MNNKSLEKVAHENQHDVWAPRYYMIITISHLATETKTIYSVKKTLNSFTVLKKKYTCVVGRTNVYFFNNSDVV